MTAQYCDIKIFSFLSSIYTCVENIWTCVILSRKQEKLFELEWKLQSLTEYDILICRLHKSWTAGRHRKKILYGGA